MNGSSPEEGLVQLLLRFRRGNSDIAQHPGFELGQMTAGTAFCPPVAETGKDGGPWAFAREGALARGGMRLRGVKDLGHGGFPVGLVEADPIHPASRDVSMPMEAFGAIPR